MTIAELEKEYLSYLNKNYNPGRAVKEKAYLYSDNKHYGLSASQMGNYFKTLTSKLTKLSKPDMVKYVKHFWDKPSHEEKMLALQILNLHADTLDNSDIPLIEKLMRESKGWVYLDNLIPQIMPVLIDKSGEIYDLLKKWASDNDFWVRRSALLAQLFYFRTGKGGDKRLFFNLAKAQFDESWIDKVYKNKLMNTRAKFFIRKAIGWVLRDMSVKDPSSVKEFLSKYRTQMSGLTYREGSRKLKSEKPKSDKLISC